MLATAHCSSHPALGGHGGKGGELLCPFVISEAEEGVDDFIILCYTTDGSEETVDYC